MILIIKEVPVEKQNYFPILGLLLFFLLLKQSYLRILAAKFFPHTIKNTFDLTPQSQNLLL